MKQNISWGILGCGSIAQKFIEDLRLVSGVEVTAVASRSAERATQFAAENQVATAYGSYQELAQDQSIDVIYIATRHPQHVENSLLCLQHGKHVVCEKPMAMSKAEAEQVIQLAKEKNLFFMEAIWTRFFPTIERLLQFLAEDKIGEIKLIQADFGFQASPQKDRLFTKSLGGGSLLDIGMYPLYLSLLTLGMPDDLHAIANFSESGIDESCAIMLSYKQGAMASLSSTFSTFTPGNAWIHGTKGSLKLHRMFHEPDQLSFYENMQHVDTWQSERKGRGYVYEIEHVNQCIQNGKTESELLPHQVSLNLQQLLDQTRAAIGLTYS